MEPFSEKVKEELGITPFMPRLHETLTFQ